MHNPEPGAAKTQMNKSIPGAIKAYPELEKSIPGAGCITRSWTKDEEEARVKVDAQGEEEARVKVDAQGEE